MRYPLTALVLVFLVLSGCSFKRLSLPRVHRLTVQQGNVITQEMIDQLKPGMTRNQVAFIMGEPVLKNTFDDDRWDYVYTIELPGVFSTNQIVSLYFIDDQLAYFTGDLAPSAAQTTEPEADSASGAASAGERPAATDQSSAARSRRAARGGTASGR